jgi:hypothetical protein
MKNSSSDSETSIHHGQNENQAEKPWESKNILFVHSALDDWGIPKGPFRVLFHLGRRLGKSGHATQPGIRSIAKTCRMKLNTVVEAITWLENNDLITVERKDRKTNKYVLKVDKKYFYIDHRLDDARLSPSEFRVLAHMSRLSDEIGRFFISLYKFEDVCCMKLETVRAALKSLGEEEKVYFFADSYAKNPQYWLDLHEKFPDERKLRLVK